MPTDAVNKKKGLMGSEDRTSTRTHNLIITDGACKRKEKEMNNGMHPIDSDRLRAELKTRGIGQDQASVEMGFSHASVAMAIRRGTISQAMKIRLETKLGITYDTIKPRVAPVPKPMPKPTAAPTPEAKSGSDPDKPRDTSPYGELREIRKNTERIINLLSIITDHITQ